MACSVIASNGKTVNTKTKACTVFANYFACVIATRIYLWLRRGCICVVEVAWLFVYL
jgi:hypothetical protein